MPTSHRAARALGLATAVAGLILLAGCSGSDGPGPAPATTGISPASTPAGTATPAGTSGPSAPASPKPLGTAKQRQHLAGLLLTRADLPSGWSASTAAGGGAATGGGSDAATQAAFAACVGVGNTFEHRVARADSPTFTKQSGSVSASATLYRSAADVTTDARAFRDRAKATSCMTSTLENQIKQGGPSVATVDSIDIQVGPGGSGDPDNTMGAITGTIKVSIGSQHATVYLDIVYLSGPRIEAEIDFTQLNAPFDAALKHRLLKTVAARVARG